MIRYSLVEGVEPLVVRGRVRHARGYHDAVAVIERYETAVEGAVVQCVEQEAVRRHEALARCGRSPRLDVARREQGGNVDALETAGAAIVGKKHAAEVVLADAREPARRAQAQAAAAGRGEKNPKPRSLRRRRFESRSVRAPTSPRTLSRPGWRETRL